jgi:hypothetical protein
MHTWQCGAGKRLHVAKSKQVSSNASFAEFSTRICIAIHKKFKFLRNLVNETRWADCSFAMNSWAWWKTIARSPDHAVPDYFLWGYVTNKVYETRPANTAYLKQRILECIQEIPKEMLRVMTAFPSWLQECIERHAGHHSIIFKQKWLR